MNSTYLAPTKGGSMDSSRRLASSLVAMAIVAVASSAYAVGGTDGCYSFSDTIAPLDGNEPTYNYTDIAGTGTQIALSDDEVSSPIPLGFTFNYYGVSYTDVGVSSNGFLTFLPFQSSGCCTGQAIPSAGSPDAIIAGWWEDLLPGLFAGTVSYQTTGGTGNQVFIVQFDSVNHYSSGIPVTFQFKLFEASQEIEVHYQSVATDGGTHSAGIENQSGTSGIQWQYGSSLSFTNTAVRYYAQGTDSDFDSVADCIDICPFDPNPGQEDSDGDGIGDACDNCPQNFNPGQEDADTDDAGDLCDLCPGFDDGNDADSDTVPDDCDTCPGLDDIDPSSSCPHLYSVSRDDGELRQVSPVTGLTLSSVEMSGGGFAVEGANGLAADPRDGTLWTVLRTIRPVSNCDLDPSRTTFAGGPGTGACGQYDGNQAACEAAWHQGDRFVAASCWYDTGSDNCRGCGYNNESGGDCVNTCKGGCPGDVTRTTFAGPAGSAGCRQFDGNQASCEAAWNVGGDGVHASCWYNIGNSQCRGCGANNQDAGLCVNTCPVCDDPARTIYVGGPQTNPCHQFDGNQTSCEQAFHTGDAGVASCWYDTGADECRGCGPNNEGADCTNTCRTFICPDDPTRTIFAGGPQSSACRQFDGNQTSCEQAFHLGEDGIASCWYDSNSDSCRGCGQNNEESCLCQNTCGSSLGRTLASVNPATGALTLAGNTGLALAAVAVDCAGEIYGLSGLQSACTGPGGALYSLDPADGSATFLVGLPAGTAAGHALAFDNSDGFLYHGSGFGSFIGLESVDPGTLVSSPVTPSGDFTGLGQVRALTYDSTSGNLLLSDGDELFDLTTAGVVAPLGVFLDHTSKGLAFDEGNVCTATVCGNGIPEMGEDCDDGNTLAGDCCSPTCTFEALGTPCPDDGDLCTVDKCDGAGMCVSAPPTGCKTPGKAILLIKDKSDNEKDKLVFKWVKGPLTTQSEFGNPVTTANYALCVYTGGLANSLLKTVVPNHNAKWSSLSTKGYKYKDPGGTAAGVTNVLLKGGDPTKSKVLVKGKGTGLPDPTLGNLPLPLVAQLVNSETNVCFQATFNIPDVKKNTAAQFKGKTQ